MVGVLRPEQSLWQTRVVRRLVGWVRTDIKLSIGGVMVAIVLLVAIASHVVLPHNPLTQHLDNTLGHPTLAHPMGTDEFGRDVLSRTLAAAGLDLQIAFIGTVFCLLLGATLGLLAGFFGGWVDLIIGRIIDVVIAFPSIVVIIALISVLGINLVNIYIAITVTGWTAYARIIRGGALRERGRAYISAASVLGYSRLRIVGRHLMPNVVTAALLFWVTDMIGTVLLVTSLSYLGLGPQPPTPEWGAMISDARPYILQAWWIALFPGLAIVFTGVGLALLGDGLADILRAETS